MLAEAQARVVRYTLEEVRADPQLLVVDIRSACAHGYSSSLAAAQLVEPGIDVGNLIGGFEAW
jgi:hypothetical protein